MDRYISKAVASVIRICIDEHNECDWKGRIYTRVKKEHIQFRNMYEMLSVLGYIWDVIGYPQESTMSRRFTDEPKQKSGLHTKAAIQVTYPGDGTRDRVRVELSDEDMEKRHGEQGTFIVKIRYRQNATWQGHVTWVEENKTVPFRSALELMKLIDSTQEENTEDWEEE